MATTEGIAQFLLSQGITSGFTLRRMLAEQAANQPAWNQFGAVPQYEPLTAERLGAELVPLVEFRLLELGAFLGTPNGQLISEGVALVIPPIYKPEYELVVNALTHAARLQQQGDRADAGKVALAVGSFAAILFLIGRFGGGSAA